MQNIKNSAIEKIDAKVGPQSHLEQQERLVHKAYPVHLNFKGPQE